jgi:hypothetical protein
MGSLWTWWLDIQARVLTSDPLVGGLDQFVYGHWKERIIYFMVLGVCQLQKNGTPNRSPNNPLLRGTRVPDGSAFQLKLD